MTTKNKKSVYEELSMKFSDAEIAESFVFPLDLTPEVKNKQDKDFMELRLKRLSEMTEKEYLQTELIRLRFQIENYLHSSKMKSVLVCLNFMLFSYVSKAQCDFDKLFPVKHGITKFESAMQIGVCKNLKINELKNEINATTQGWTVLESNKKDSFYLTSGSYDYTYNNCLKGYSSSLYIAFADDKLYKIQTRSFYEQDDMQDCLNNYNDLIEYFKKQFVEWEAYDLTNYMANEKTGMGYTFYPKEKKKSTLKEKEYLDIRFTINFKFEYENGKAVRTSTILYYDILILYISLNGTKLDSGFY